MTRHQLLAGVCASILLVSACGSDSNTSGSPSPETAAACDTWITADTALVKFSFTGEGDADAVNGAFDDAIAAADPDRAETLSDLKDSLQPIIEDPESEPSDELMTQFGDALSWVEDNCDVVSIDVSAKEFEYDGIPDTLSTGYTVVNFANVGNEMHEMFAFRFNDGVDETLDEIVALPEDEVFSKITPMNATFAMPGGSDTGSWNLSEPGRYVVVCFIPLGTTANNEGDGPPHFTQGMFHEFTVTS